MWSPKSRRKGLSAEWKAQHKFSNGYGKSGGKYVHWQVQRDCVLVDAMSLSSRYNMQIAM